MPEILVWLLFADLLLMKKHLLLAPLKTTLFFVGSGFLRLLSVPANPPIIVKGLSSVIAFFYTDVGTTRFLEDASFLRLKNLTLGYTLPQSICKKLLIFNLRVYFSASNLFTITGFNGWNPEIRLTNNKNGANAQGIIFEGNEMPQIRTFSIGASIKF